MPEKAPEEPKPLSFATPNPWSALPREVYVGKGRGKKEGATKESPVDGQDQPKIYTIRDHTLEVLMHPDVLELHAVRVVHTPHGDERQLHLKVRVRCGQEELVVDVLVDTGAHTYDFSSCFFPKFKKSAKRGFSREMTYFFGFYGPKIGGGGPPTRILSKKIKNPEIWPILGYFCLLWAGPAEQCCTPVYLPIEDFRQKFQFSLDSLAPK